MALLQVALFPLRRVTGGEEHFAFISVIVQLVFGIASFLSPFVYSYLGSDLTDNQTNDGIIISLVALITPDNLPWVSSCKLDIWVSQNISWIQTGKRRCSHSKIILGDDDFIFTFSLYIESELLGRSNH